MKGNFLLILALGIGVSIFSSPVFAHHGNAAYDTGKTITVKGTVTQWNWSNPHCILQLDVADTSNQVVHWYAETENPSSMIRYGWSNQSFKAGDLVTVTVLPVKNGRPVGRIIDVVLANGQELHGRAIPVLDSPKPEDPPKQ